jgi:hypothetical protein
VTRYYTSVRLSIFCWNKIAGKAGTSKIMKNLWLITVLYGQPTLESHAYLHILLSLAIIIDTNCIHKKTGL